MRLSPVIVATALPLALLSACSSGPEEVKPAAAGTNAAVPVARKAAPAANKKAPKYKHLGIYVEKPKSIGTQFKTFKKNLNKRPTIVKGYSAWNVPFNAAWATEVAKNKALPQIEWEPHGQSLKAIGSGKSDAYVKKFAQDVAAFNKPVSISFAHEMNGYWYDWGTKKAKPADFVKSWKRVHDIFQAQGANNVIWLWSPNTIGPVPKVKLKPYYPGSAYVDWVGVIGYYRHNGGKPESFKGIFDPTLKQISSFSKKPVLIAETAALPGKYRQKDIADLLGNIGKRKNLIGVIWFNLKKAGHAETDWRIENSRKSLSTFKTYVNKYPFGAK